MTHRNPQSNATVGIVATLVTKPNSSCALPRRHQFIYKGDEYASADFYKYIKAAMCVRVCAQSSACVDPCVVVWVCSHAISSFHVFLKVFPPVNGLKF